jgi:hypothetical protein
VTDSIQSNLGGAMTAAEIAEQRRLVQFFNYPWPMGPVVVERGEREMAETKHCWICEDCPRVIMFRQPELPDEDPRSEVNDDKDCPTCGEPMYFEEVEDG